MANKRYDEFSAGSDTGDKIFLTADPATGELGKIDLTNLFSLNGVRLQEYKGANVTAANDLTLGTDGNLFVITGNTTINAITIANWQAGSVIGFVFTGTPTVKHNTSGGGGTATMLLAGSADYVAAAGDYLELRYDGTNWHEVVRKIAASDSGPTLTADNGLEKNTATNVRLGGTGVQNTSIDWAAFTFTNTFNSIVGSGFKITSNSTAADTDSQKLVEISLSGANANSGQDTCGLYSSNAHTGGGFTRNYGVYGTADGATVNTGVFGSGGNGVWGNGTSYGVYGTGVSGGMGGNFEAQDAVALGAAGQNATTNDVSAVFDITRATQGAAGAAGIGGSIRFFIYNSTPTGIIANTFVSKLIAATAGAETSQLILTGRTAGAEQDWLTLGQNGYMKLKPMTAAQASALTPAEGMIVIVSDTDATFTSIGFWGYSNSAWAKF